MERREIIDMATGIAGGLLLITAVVLFAVVPEEEPIPPVFLVSYVPTETTVPIGTILEFEEGATIDVPVTIDSEYMYRIAFTVQWTDDVPSSDPDRFQFKIFEPLGEQVTDEARKATNEPPMAETENTTGLESTTYTAQTMVFVMDKSLGAPPRDGPVPGAHLDEDATNVKSRLLEDLKTYEAGEWILEVHLGDAGDCPTAQAESSRYAVCTEETDGSGDDTGNNIEIISVTYTTYDIQIQEPV